MMKARFIFSISVFCCFVGFHSVLAQDVLITRMKQHEHNILSSYLEYQKLYYEDKSRKHELQAFENLLTVYINQVVEIYNTLNLSERKASVPRDIASRAQIFKALMYLKKAPLNVDYYEKACYEYYEALNLYNGTDEVPVIYKDLPQTIQAGDKTYYRLIDLLEEKGIGLRDFGKVKISFRNFMVTANFDPQMLVLKRVNGTNPGKDITFLLAQERIRHAFSEVFRRTREFESYVALPAGTYILNLSGRESRFTPLTRFYVKANQEQHYIMEPLADWVILYENPTSKRPDFYKFSRSQMASTDNRAPKPSTNGNGSHKSNGSTETGLNAKHAELVSDIVETYLPQFEIKLMFDLNDPEIRTNAIEIISRSIVQHLESSTYYNKWNNWSACWEISKKVREVISPVVLSR